MMDGEHEEDGSCYLSSETCSISSNDQLSNSYKVCDTRLAENEKATHDEKRSSIASCDDANDEKSQIEDEEESFLGNCDSNEDLNIRKHPSYEQVILDVNRCAGRLEHIRQCYFHRTDEDGPPEDLTPELDRATLDSDCESMQSDANDKIGAECSLESDRIKRLKEDLKCQRKLKRKLAELIVKLLIRKPDLHYYQGFHDVCLTYMTIYGDEAALERLDRVVDSHFSQFMRPTMLETQEFLAMIPIIIGQHDSKVRDFLEQAEVGTIYALSWTITWFSHVIPNERDVETIFTFLERFDDPFVILYLCAAIVIHKKDKLLELEPEMSLVHHYLCQLPRKERLPIQDLLRETEASFKRWPPNVIREKLDDYRRNKLQVQNINLVQKLTQRVIPTLGQYIGLPTPRTALVVFVLASAMAFQFDRWIR